ncbi:MAG: formylglycine-generating enzyme family protein, partial [Bacteroidales bacterium]|nr:formylglycine-generating enzyme family protein [Bacteroidales bacterium]
FRPGCRPVGVILPDNAWELGYSSFSAGNLSVCALARRTGTEDALTGRYETILPPGAVVHYKMYNCLYSGEWQEGIQMMFRDKYLFDLDRFDDSLYARSDLAWIRNSYIIILQMAWDREFYDSQTGGYTYPEFLKKSIGEFGRVDVYGLCATCPGLGLDRRNQQDMYRDLPGGIPQLRNFVSLSRSGGTKFFIAYNFPDNGMKKEDLRRGMTALVRDLDADGVILETGADAGCDGLQAAVDSIRSGVIMYYDGMAGVKEMERIISGRVYNSIFLSPELNLSKFIKPEYAIFRVCDVGEDILHREIAVSFFNGYGTELNMFRPGGRNDDYNADKEFLARTTFLLRQNNDAFTDKNWIPLIETSVDNIFVNRWHSEGKTIYTVLNLRPEGHTGPLFEVSGKEGSHYVSLWNHENIVAGEINGKVYAGVRADAWPSVWAGTRREGSVDCIAEFPDILKSELKGGDSISINSSGQGVITVWKGNPSYNTEKRDMKVKGDTTISLRNLFGWFEGKIVIQLIENDILRDENVLNVRGGRPWPVNRINKSAGATAVPPDMLLIPESTFAIDVRASDEFIPYPETGSRQVTVDTFLIDRYPVTNAQYYEFISRTGYRPADTTRYLRHWSSGTYKQGQEKYPVVYISYEDALAYAQWAGKRLPSEAEWQLAAQGTDMRKWPWGNEFHATYCNNSFERPTPVDAFPKGQSPYGVMDMVGNIWQMTNDMYFNGSNYFIIIRGGSFHKPESGNRNVSGGPQPLDRTQIMLRVSAGFERSETLGFRCARDIDKKRFSPGK